MKPVDQRRAQWQVPFFTIWAGQAFSLLGSSLVQFALVWWLTKTTGSATVLATASLVALLPGVFLSPFVGALVDRWSRRLLMILADGLIALAAAGMAYLFYIGAAHPWHIYVVMFIRSIGSGFHWPAMQASTSLMVPEEHLSRVAGLNQSLRGGVNIVGPPLGALLLSLLPLHGILAIDVGTAVLAIVPLFFVHIPQPERKPTAEARKPSLLGDVREGLRYVWDWPGLLAVGVMAMVINFLFNPAFSLVPILVTKHFGGEALELGWIESAWGIGVVLGGLVLGVWGGFRRRILTSMMGLIVTGLSILLLGMTPASAFWLGVGAIFLAGLMNPITNGPLFAVLQAVVDPGMQGRVLTLLQSASTAMSPLSLAIAGPVADLLGVRAWYVVGGVVCTLMGVGGCFVPAVVHLEDNHRERVVEGMTAIADVSPAHVDME
ncbi:MAG: MFS transporter [Anaerolineae bacterium]|jgi:DHA3 family macrolide efflux protein-like MFS transporter